MRATFETQPPALIRWRAACATIRVGDLLAMVTKFGREQPVAFFAGAVVAGFALSRFIKVGASEAAPSTNEVGE